jgi:tetratricopeptide (TPR) repeat protein
LCQIIQALRRFLGLRERGQVRIAKHFPISICGFRELAELFKRLSAVEIGFRLDGGVLLVGDEDALKEGVVAIATGATPDASPAAAPSDPAQDLEDLLTIPDLDKKPTASARLIYAKSELTRFQKKPQIEAQLLLDIADKFKPEDLSPAILGQVGDCLVQSGKPDQADAFYHEIIDEYDQSPLVDYAYNGLAQIAYDKKDFKKALGYYSTALDKGVAATKLKEITLGQAQTLMALDRYEEAKPLFEQVASNRAWRGEATALSVLSLGSIQMAQAKYAEATRIEPGVKSVLRNGRLEPENRAMAQNR